MQFLNLTPSIRTWMIVPIFGVVSTRKIVRVDEPDHPVHAHHAQKREFGIELLHSMAQSRSAGDILRMILVQGLKVAAVGLAIGLAMALPLPKLFESIFQGQVLFGAPAVYLVVLAVMLIVNFSATLGPARRATRVDPTAALRSE